jgi:tetratricopeptide (TPR) repeat protein
LVIHRAIGNRREEGVILGLRGDLLARLGRLDEAWRAFEQGAVVLRELGDALHLSSLLAVRGCVEFNAGRRDAAAALLAEAEGMAAPLNLPAASDTAREIARLRGLLG